MPMKLFKVFQILMLIISEEIDQSEKHGKEVDEDGLISVDFSFDAQWDKRFGFNSLVGGGAAIGKLTGQVIAFGVKVKRCSVCQWAEQYNKAKPKHKCYFNHTGSAKSMKTAIGVDIAKEIRTKGATTDTITMDEDTSVIKNMKEQVPHGENINKSSDVNHLKKIYVHNLSAVKNDKHYLSNPKEEYYHLYNMQHLVECFTSGGKISQ